MALLIFILGACTIYYFVYVRYFKPHGKPILEEKQWRSGKESTEIVPFKIDVSENVITDLKQRLQNALPLEESLTNDQSLGMNSNLLKTVLDYWKNEYNWRVRQDYLNKYPQFKTNIQGLNIHFVHVVPDMKNGAEKVPLLLLHGWPSSFADFHEMIPLLTKPQNEKKIAFEVIIPSLPGFAFSDGGKVSGLCPANMAIVFKNLMKRLGHNQFYIHGGDWGAITVQQMATLFPEHVLGIHTTMPYLRTPLATIKTLLGSLFPSLMGISSSEYRKIYPLSNTKKILSQESGYSHLQSTKPDTVGVALRDSPIGLAAYILEKFVTGTNIEWQKLEDGGLTKKFTMDQLLDNVMIYWVSRSMATSLMIYYNFVNSKLKLDRVPITVPAGFAKFYNELFFFPKAICGDKYVNLIHCREYDDGGHFAALEEPKTLSKDIIDFVGKVRNE